MWLWIAMAVGAFVVGTAKTSISGMNAIAVLIFAFIMPTKSSTGAVLLLYMIGDVVAVARYRKDCRWSLLVGLLPWVLPGIVLGATFLHMVNDLWLRRGIGMILLISMVPVLMTIGRKRPILQWPTGNRAASAGVGIAAGFTTMAANSGGPVMALYLLIRRVDKATFVGTGAWYYFIVNATKVPFSIAVGAMNIHTLVRTVYLAPFVLLGTAFGIWLLKRIPPKAFDYIVLAASALSAVILVCS